MDSIPFYKISANQANRFVQGIVAAVRTVPRKLEANVLARILQFGSQIDGDRKGCISVTGAMTNIPVGSNRWNDIHIIQVFGHAEICNVFALHLATQHSHRRSSGWWLSAKARLSLQLFIPHTAETETYRIWNICTSIFCILSTLDENLLDVIRRREIERKKRKNECFYLNLCG